MLTNVEQNNRHSVRRASRIGDIRQALSDAGREPSDAAVAAELGLAVADIPMLEATVARGTAVMPQAGHLGATVLAVK